MENATLKLYSKQHVQELIRKRTGSMTSSEAKAESESILDQYEDLYPTPESREQFRMDYRRAVKKLDEYNENKRRFIVAILESCSPSAKEKLRVHPKYSEALGNQDLCKFGRSSTKNSLSEANLPTASPLPS